MNRDDEISAGENAVMQRGDYLAVTYSPERAPFGPYPGKLARHLHEKWLGRPGRLLDLGCGRGEYLSAFASLGHETAGVDISPSAPDYAPAHDVKVVDLIKSPMPFAPESFDFVFSKSVIEHVREPVVILEKVRSALKPGGLALIMTPSWTHTFRGPFYIDHTHVTPFTIPSLNDCMQLSGLTVVKTYYLRQLPFLWSHKWLLPFVVAFSKLPLPYQPMNDVNLPPALNKLIRFSKEVMILSVARRPD